VRVTDWAGTHQYRLFDNGLRAVLVTGEPNGPIFLQTKVAALGHLADTEQRHSHHDQIG
jgi:hypothetical protein